jgi:hypothetical protein
MSSGDSVSPYCRLKKQKQGFLRAAGTKKGPNVRLASALQRCKERHLKLNETQPVLALKCSCQRNCFETFCASELKALREEFYSKYRADERKEFLKTALRPPEALEGQHTKKLEIFGSPVCTTAVKFLFGISITLINCVKAAPSSELVGV